MKNDLKEGFEDAITSDGFKHLPFSIKEMMKMMYYMGANRVLHQITKVPFELNAIIGAVSTVNDQIDVYYQSQVAIYTTEESKLNNLPN